MSLKYEPASEPGADFLPDDANDGHCRRLFGGDARLEVLPHRRPGPDPSSSSSLLLFSPELSDTKVYEP